MTGWILWLVLGEKSRTPGHTVLKPGMSGWDLWKVLRGFLVIPA
jgi:hypothetical protein